MIAWWLLPIALVFGAGYTLGLFCERGHQNNKCEECDYKQKNEEELRKLQEDFVRWFNEIHSKG